MDLIKHKQMHTLSFILETQCEKLEPLLPILPYHLNFLTFLNVNNVNISQYAVHGLIFPYFYTIKDKVNICQWFLRLKVFVRYMKTSFKNPRHFGQPIS